MGMLRPLDLEMTAIKRQFVTHSSQEEGTLNAMWAHTGKHRGWDRRQMEQGENRENMGKNLYCDFSWGKKSRQLSEQG